MSLAFASSAQLGIKASYQLGFSGNNLYSSEMKNSYVGLNAKLTYEYDDYINFNFGTGYYLIPFKKLAIDGVQQDVSDANLSVIPVTIGADFTFLDQRANVKQKYYPYIGIDMGWAMANQSKSSLAPSASYNNFFLAPSIGVYYRLTDFVHAFGEVRQNILIYNYRGVNEYYEVFSLASINLGLTYKF